MVDASVSRRLSRHRPVSVLIAIIALGLAALSQFINIVFVPVHYPPNYPESTAIGFGVYDLFLSVALPAFFAWRAWFGGGWVRWMTPIILILVVLLTVGATKNIDQVRFFVMTSDIALLISIVSLWLPASARFFAEAAAIRQSRRAARSAFRATHRG